MNCCNSVKSWLKDSFIKNLLNTSKILIQRQLNKLSSIICMRAIILYHSGASIQHLQTDRQIDRQMCDIKNRRWGEWSCKIMPDTDMTWGCVQTWHVWFYQNKLWRDCSVSAVQMCEGCHPNPGAHQNKQWVLVQLWCGLTEIWTQHWPMTSKWNKIRTWCHKMRP